MEQLSDKYTLQDLQTHKPVLEAFRREAEILWDEALIEAQKTNPRLLSIANGRRLSIIRATPVQENEDHLIELQKKILGNRNQIERAMELCVAHGATLGVDGNILTEGTMDFATAYETIRSLDDEKTTRFDIGQRLENAMPHVATALASNPHLIEPLLHGKGRGGKGKGGPK